MAITAGVDALGSQRSCVLALAGWPARSSTASASAGPTASGTGVIICAPSRTNGGDVVRTSDRTILRFGDAR